MNFLETRLFGFRSARLPGRIALLLIHHLRGSPRLLLARLILSLLVLALPCSGAAALLGAARPAINSFSPLSGAPGTSVTMHGVSLSGATEVRFNTSIAIFTLVSSAQIVATVPLDATTGPLSVTTSFGTAVTATHFVVAPRIIDFSPTNASPGAVVILEGANFLGTTAVRFNGRNAAAFSVTGQNQIHATVPVGASSGPISVTTAAGTGISAKNFIVTGTEPIIAEFFPPNGVPGTIVTLEGRNFTGATSVKFNGTNAATFSVTAPTQISATVPAGATSGPISVTTPSGTGLSPQPFVVTTAPLITDFSPATGPPGTSVRIEGANFTGATAVRFNGANAASFSVPAPTQISAIVPPAATTGPISVTTAKGTGTSAASFFVTTAPVITDFAPTNGPVGTIVTIDGVNFAGVTSVKFNGTNSLEFSLVSPTQIRATVPAGATTGPIVVASAKGAGSSTNHFVVTTGIPLLTGFSPASGSPGTIVTIDGLHFTGATAVKFNGAGTSFTVTAPTQIMCAVPPDATSGFLSVTTPAGTGSSTAKFFVAPRLASFSPTNGIVGSTVLIRGTNFTDVLAVQFSGVTAAFTNPSPNEIKATVPAEAVTGTISVTTPAGIVASTNAFVVLPSSDLETAQFSSPNPIPLGTDLTYTFTVTNRGPSTANAVSFTNTLPANVSFISATVTQGSLRRASGAVMGDFGSLAVGAGARLVLVVTPTTVGSITNTVRVRAAETDPNPNNNAVAEVTTVLVGPALLSVQRLSNNRVVVSWPASGTNFVLQFSDRLTATTEWLAETNAPIVQGDRRTITVPAPTGNRFYRLQRP